MNYLGLLPVLTLSLLPVSLANSMDELPISQVIDGVSRNLDAILSGIQQRRGSEMPSSDRDLLFSANPPPWKVSSGKCAQLDVKKVCTQAALSCFSLGQRSVSCIESEPSVQMKRYRYRALRELTALEAISYFSSQLESPEVQAHCCGQDPKCRTRLSNTRFVLLKGSDPSVEGGHYLTPTLWGGHVIRIPDESLVKVLDLGNIHRMVSHELGHACQFSRRWNREWNRWGCDSVESEIRDVESLVGKEMTDCLRGKIAQEWERFVSAPSHDSVSPCKRDWWQETFAMLFEARYWRGPTYLGSFCASVSDETHPPGKAIIGCLLEHDEVFRSGFCRD